MNQWRLGFKLWCGDGVNDKGLPGLMQVRSTS